MAAASSSSDVREVEHAECRCVLLVAPWTAKCDSFVLSRGGIPELLHLASEHGELHIDESGNSRRAYIVKVFLYATLPPPELCARFNKNGPMHLDSSKAYAMYFLRDREDIFKGLLDFQSGHLADLPAEQAPFLEEIRNLIAFLANSAGAARQNKRSSLD